jgi:hypothetical protein
LRQIAPKPENKRSFLHQNLLQKPDYRNINFGNEKCEERYKISELRRIAEFLA